MLNPLWGFFSTNKMKLISNIKEFLERDSDITYYDEFNYIKICLLETIRILTYNIKRKILKSIK